VEEVLDPALTERLANPAISPEGRQVAFQLAPVGGTLGVWIYDLAQGTFSPLGGDSSDSGPFWSPDGRELGFSSHRDARTRFYFALYSRPPDQSTEARLLFSDPDDAMHEASWTPDMRWLVYRRGSTETTGRADLWYVAPHPDSTPHMLLETPFNEWNPALSPDGRWLAYVSDESGAPEVYVRPFPGSGGRYQVSNTGGMNPVWAKNGREIFYLAGRPPAVPTMTVASLRTDGGFAAEARESLFTWLYRGGISANVAARQWDLAPDGQRILAFGVPREGIERAGRYVVVQNFLEGFEQDATASPR
jgi:Tol biopolymer transport system component